MKQLSCGAPSLWSQVSGTQNCSGLQSSWEGRQCPECPCRPLSKLGWGGKESTFEVGSNEVRGKAEAGETGEGVTWSSGGVARKVGEEGGPPLFAFMKGSADTKKKNQYISWSLSWAKNFSLDISQTGFWIRVMSFGFQNWNPCSSIELRPHTHLGPGKI